MQPDERNKGVIFKNCEPFIDCTSEINNTQIDYAKDLDFAMPMYNLIEQRSLFKNRSRWQYYRDEPAAAMINFESFKSKIKVTGKPPADGNSSTIKVLK